jgi:signal transduction histidine kinase
MIDTENPFVGLEIVGGWAQQLAPYGIFTTDIHLTVRTWNQWLVSHSGLPAEAAVGRSLLELFPDLAGRGLAERFARALEGEVSMVSAALHRYLLPFPPLEREFDVAHMLQSGRIAPIFWDGRIVGTITIIEDVTQRECQAAILYRQQEHDRLLSQALALLHQTDKPLDIAADLFPVFAPSLKLDVFLNYLVAPEGDRLVLHSAGGLSPEAKGARATLEFGEDLSGEVAATRRAVVAGHLQASADDRGKRMRQLGLRAYAGYPLLVGQRLIGTLAYGTYERDAIPPRDVEFLSKIAHYTAISLDRAQGQQALMRADAQLRRHSDELELKVSERTAKLHDTIFQLESFSYTVAHDLRAPIRALTGYTEILLSEFAAALPTEAAAMLRRLNVASRHLDLLTRDLLLLSRIAREKIALQPVDVSEIVADIVDSSPALQACRPSIAPALGTVKAHRRLLQQCLSNLLDNAVKFSVPGSSPRITVRSEVRNDRIRIWVEDEGIGIPAVAHGRIFEIFERLPGPSQTEGTGIGLAIVARAAAEMQGSYGVESAEGKGSRFWVEFARG